MHPKRILVVDDNRVVLKAISMKLRAHGYAVSTAEDCARALAMARRNSPELLLVDVSFPPALDEEGAPWDGFLLMRWLKRFPETSSIPVVVMTGSQPEKHRDRAAASGALAFLRKPLKGEELLRTLGSIFDKAPAGA